MSVFTKEELLIIHEALIYLFSDNNAGDTELVRKLNLKIKEMIDNYCEHEWGIDCHNCDIDRVWCIECGKDLKNDNK